MKFRKWVSNTLFTIMMLLVITLSGECESTLLFVTSKVIALFGIVGIGYLLVKYANVEE